MNIPPAPSSTPRIDPRRAAVAVVVLAILLVPVYFLLLRDGNDVSNAGLVPARLLDTPAAEGERLAVGLGEGDLAPDFEISTPDGERVRLSGLRGRPVLINFWARWCGSCLSEMPEIKAVQELRGLDSFSVLAVNAGETRDEALQFIDFLQAPFIYGLDLDLMLSDAYGVYGLPLSVFVDSGGVVRAVYRGHADRPRLETLLSAAIEARPPGELPIVLRTISTIPRQRILTVDEPSPGRLILTSRSLRCDPSYCATPAIASIRSLTGVLSVTETSREPEPVIAVAYDPAVITTQAIVTQLASALMTHRDPVYNLEIELKYTVR